MTKAIQYNMIHDIHVTIQYYMIQCSTIQYNTCTSCKPVMTSAHDKESAVCLDYCFVVNHNSVNFLFNY